MKFYYGTHNRYIDVTNILSQQNTGIITVTSNYNQLFSDPVPGRIKHLKIESSEFGVVKIRENAPFTLLLQPRNIPSIHVVYFINTYCNLNYIHLLRSQLLQLKESGLLREAKFHVQVCSDNDIIISQVHELIPEAEIEVFQDNTHEYHGIHKVWEIGQTNPDCLILYFHSKGITHIKSMTPQNCRLPFERALFNQVITSWQRLVNVFKYFPSIDKLGLSCSDKGWVWYNYFWVRANYAIKCEEPIKNHRRHYYEDWVARYLKETAGSKEGAELPVIHKNYILKYVNCFNLTGEYNIGSFFNPDNNRWF
jgi:hypothetical protein